LIEDQRKQRDGKLLVQKDPVERRLEAKGFAQSAKRKVTPW